MAGRARSSPFPRRKTPGRTAGAAKLKEYRARRQFTRTPEPEGTRLPTPGKARFTIQKHDATQLHYDLRLEADGTLKSWAIPKGPSLDPADRRLAVRMEDHPLEYLTFEGVIPEGEYGAGPMIVWDTGTYENIKQDRQGRVVPMSTAVERGSVKVRLSGRKLRGDFALVRTRRNDAPRAREQWFLIKLKDEHARADARVLNDHPESAISGRQIEDLNTARGSTKGNTNNRTRKKTARSSSRRQGSDTMPSWVAPMLATLVDRPVRGDAGEWIYEHKYDGFRALAFREGDKLQLLSRNRKNLADRFPEIAEALRELPLDEFIIDGEIVALRSQRPSFSELQKRLKATTLEAVRRAGSAGVQLRFYVFDLLHLAGHDIRRLPLIERKELLARLFPPRRAGRSGYISFSEHMTAPGGDSKRLLQKACREGWEGLIAKKAQDPYISGRSRSWLKLKCSLRQEFVIGGYTDPQGSRSGFGALLVGYYEEGRLRYAGKVGTGYSDRTLREILELLQPLQRKTSPFAPDVELPRARPARGGKPGAIHFVTPRLVCEVAFSEWTDDNHIRHPRFIGLRPDKNAADVVRERAASPP